MKAGLDWDAYYGRALNETRIRVARYGNVRRACKRDDLPVGEWV
jgi:hypothetical protein